MQIMEIAGITLQLVAAVILALPSVVQGIYDRAIVQTANSSLKSFLNYPSAQKGRAMKVSFAVALISIAAFWIIVGIFEIRKDTDTKVWEWILGGFLGLLIYLAAYAVAMDKLAGYIRNIKALECWIRQDFERSIAVANSVLFVLGITVIAIWMSVVDQNTPLAIFLLLLIAGTITVPWLIGAGAWLFLYLLFQFFGWLATAGRGALWGLALVVYIIGGTLLIIAAVRG